MKKNMTERQLAAAIYRLSDSNHAKADLALLVEKSPAIKSSPSFKAINFSPRHHHALILKLLLAVATEQEIEAHRLPDTEEETPPTEEETPPVEEETPPSEEETPPAEEETPPAEGEKTTSESATVPGSSAAGQNIKSAAGQNKKKSQKKKNTPTSTGKTSSTKTSSGQS